MLLRFINKKKSMRLKNALLVVPASEQKKHLWTWDALSVFSTGLWMLLSPRKNKIRISPEGNVLKIKIEYQNKRFFLNLLKKMKFRS